MRELIAKAKKLNKIIIGPATVGGIVAGAFKNWEHWWYY
jgi:succinyl-CoA synthetase alpha subunit